MTDASTVYQQSLTDLNTFYNDYLVSLDTKLADMYTDVQQILDDSYTAVRNLPVVNQSQTDYFEEMIVVASSNGNVERMGITATVATTANITLSGLLTVDGVKLIAGDRVLVKNQTTKKNNGLFVVTAGAWSRTADADQVTELNGIRVFVLKGTTNGNTSWTLTTAITAVGVSSISFTRTSAKNIFNSTTVSNAAKILSDAMKRNASIISSSEQNYNIMVTTLNDEYNLAFDGINSSYTQNEAETESQFLIDDESAMQKALSEMRGAVGAIVMPYY